MNRKTSFFLVLLSLILCPALSPSAAAAEEQLVSIQLDLIQEGALPTPTEEYAVPMLFSAAPSLDTYLYEALWNCQTEIDVRQFSLMYDPLTGSSDGLSNAMTRVINSHPELFYVTGRCSFNYDSSNHVVRILPEYAMSGDTLAEARSFYDSALNGILSLLDENWTDLETVLFVNDYLTSHYQYDTSYTINDAYNFLAQGTGVCQSYYLTTRALLNACNIPSGYGRSAQANHIWNIVQLDGKWYHLDVTWNDPTPDAFGAARHDYFLLSTATMLKQDPTRSDWISDQNFTCADTTYDQFYWKDVTAPFVCINNVWYYSDSSAIKQTADVSQPGTTVITHSRWPNLTGSGYWNGAYSGLGAYNGWLLYNTADKLIAYAPQSGESRTVYTTQTTDRDIYGFLCSGDSAVCELRASPIIVGIQESCPLSCLDLVITRDQEKTYGDITVCEGSCSVTILVPQLPTEERFIMAAAYTEDDKMCDFRMILSTDLEQTFTQWKLQGKKAKIFLLTREYTPLV